MKQNAAMSDGDESVTTSPATEPEYRSSIYLISTRPVSHMNRFSTETLLFQPDTRMYCHHGSDCAVRNKEHTVRYNHVLPAVGATPPSTPGNPFSVPGVSHTWSLANSEFVNKHIGAESLPRDSRVVLYVHGHRTRYYKATATLRHIDDLCAASYSSQPYVVMGFLWPSHSKKVSYVKARPKASGEASVRLTDSIRALQARGNEIHIVAHSLGCRLALSCLFSNKNTESESILPVKSLIMLAAAVSEHDFQMEFPRELLNVGTIFNVFSTNDPVLDQGFQLAEAASGIYASLLSLLSAPLQNNGGGDEGAARFRNSAIGVTGVTASIEGYHDVNGSTEITTHSIHAYLAAPSVQQLLRQCVFGLI